METITTQIANHAEELKRLSARKTPADFPALWLMTDSTRLHDPVTAVKQLPIGAGVVLRDYQSTNRLSLAHDLSRLCRTRGLKLLIGADPLLARQVDANGVHWPKWAIKRARLASRDPNWLITFAAHDKALLTAGKLCGAHAAFVSPIFATASHPEAQPIGITQLAAMTHTADLPIIALGGIDHRNVTLLKGSGVAGIAAITGLSPGVR